METSHCRLDAGRIVSQSFHPDFFTRSGGPEMPSRDTCAAHRREIDGYVFPIVPPANAASVTRKRPCDHAGSRFDTMSIETKRADSRDQARSEITVTIRVCVGA
jgi:hypothetical protein